MNLAKEIKDSRESYANQWNFTSEFYNNKGYYEIFSAWVPSKSKILEIGCGSGYSTLELLKNSEFIHSIEENTEYIKMASELLKTNYIDHQSILRGETLEDRNTLNYKTSYKKLSQINNSHTLIESNIVADLELKKAISAIKYDVVTAWLIGFHKMINTSTEFDSFIDNMTRSLSETTKLKFKILSSIADHAKALLKEEGFFYLIERVTDEIYENGVAENLLNTYSNTFKGFIIDRYEVIDAELKSIMNMMQDGNKITKTNKMNFLRMKFVKK